LLLVFKLLGWIAPPRIPASAAAIPMAELARRWSRWEIGGTAAGFGAGVASVFAWFKLLGALAPRLTPIPADTRFLIPADDAFWMLPAIFLGIATAGAVMVAGTRAILGAERYEEFDAYGQRKVGFHSIAVLKWFSAIIVIVACLVIRAGVNHAVTVGDGGLTTPRRFGQGSAFHAFSSVKGIRAEEFFQAPSGELVRRPHYIVAFADGTDWTTRDGRAPRPEADAAVIRFVSQRSGKPVAAPTLR
jgi:hypothetical protein